LYTSRGFWDDNMADAGKLPPLIFPHLEDAHWVSATLTLNRATPYASQQAKGMDAEWYHPYGGWTTAAGTQFTDNALVAGRRTCASVFAGTQADLKRKLGLS
jgi:hypothetical protein